MYMGRGGVAVCSVPFNWRVAGSNLMYLTPMRIDLGKVAQCSPIILSEFRREKQHQGVNQPLLQEVEIK